MFNNQLLYSHNTICIKINSSYNWPTREGEKDLVDYYTYKMFNASKYHYNILITTVQRGRRAIHLTTFLI